MRKPELNKHVLADLSMHKQKFYTLFIFISQ